MRYLFVGDLAHAALKSSALLGKFDTFALPLFDDVAFELVKAEKIGKTSIEAVEAAADDCVAVLNFVEEFVGLRPAGVLI